MCVTCVEPYAIKTPYIKKSTSSRSQPTAMTFEYVCSVSCVAVMWLVRATSTSATVASRSGGGSGAGTSSAASSTAKRPARTRQTATAQGWRRHRASRRSDLSSTSAAHGRGRERRAAALVGAVGRSNHRVDHPQPAQARETKRVSTNTAPRLPTISQRPRVPRADATRSMWALPLARLRRSAARSCV